MLALLLFFAKGNAGFSKTQFNWFAGSVLNPAAICTRRKPK